MARMAQKWEYLTVDRVVTTGGALIMRVNGQDIGERGGRHHDRKYPTLYEYLNELGDRGWELSGLDGGQYIFKRLLADAPVTAGPDLPSEEAVEGAISEE